MMLRTITLSLLVAIASTGNAFAQQWTQKLLKETSHDFGSVARGSKAEFAFEIENVFKEDVHIASVRSSCGCTSPVITKDTLKSWEKGSILAKFNTTSYLGQRHATITAVIDKPYYAEVQLNVSGFIRSDVVFEPGVVNLGQLDVGESGAAKVKVTYAGRENWNIVDVRSGNPNLEVELSDAVRRGGNVTYEMTVRLKGDVPAGYMNDQLMIVSDDVRNKTIPITVEARISPPLEVSPGSLLLGSVEPGKSVTKQLVVKAKKKFRITNVVCEDEGFRFKLPAGDTAKTMHLVPVIFTAGEEPGAFTATMTIETDLGMTAQCKATGNVKAAGDAAVQPTPKTAAARLGR